MEPAPDEVVVRHGAVDVARIREPGDAEAALQFLDRVGATADAPVVDEAERARLEQLAGGHQVAGHQAALVRRDGDVLGYLGATDAPSDAVRGDLAVRPGGHHGATLDAGLDAAVEIGTGAGARRLELWLRRVEDNVIERVAERGFVVARRLAVLGRSLEDPPTGGSPSPEGITIRGSRPDDEREIVEVLGEAYAGTAEAGWDLESFRARQAYAWFDPADLLVAVDDEAGIVGLHWTKRRSAHVGEVYNLAIAPSAQGRGLGQALLTAGLAHLHSRGAEEVLLWVDTANEPAMALYAAHGFRIRWEDVAVGRDL